MRSQDSSQSCSDNYGMGVGDGGLWLWGGRMGGGWVGA